MNYPFKHGDFPVRELFVQRVKIFKLGMSRFQLAKTLKLSHKKGYKIRFYQLNILNFP